MDFENSAFENSGNDSVIEAQGLGKRYGSLVAVREVELRVARGVCWGLLGPNGAGKTTLLRMLIGATPPSEGRLWVLGHPIPAQARPMRRRIGVVPQQDTLDPDFTVVENLRTYGDYFGLRGRALSERVETLLDFANLAHKREVPIGTLSGGMQRRLSLARALINRPDLLILDEPTTGLDPQARHLLWQRLRDLKHQGMTLVLTTHYMEEAERLCDRVTVMDHGRLLDSDPPRALIRRTIEPHVVEVHGPGLTDWRAEAEQLSARCEGVGETLFCYVRDEQPLLASVQRRPALSYIHRPANLEDVFVKLTGRELRDEQ